MGGEAGHGVTWNPLLSFVSTPAAQGAEISSTGRQLVSHSSHREYIQQGGKACAPIWRAAGPRRGWAEAQLLPGIGPDKQARSRKLEALQLHQGWEEAVQTSLLGVPLTPSIPLTSGRIGNRRRPQPALFFVI